jgi:hypothetical protein
MIPARVSEESSCLRPLGYRDRPASYDYHKTWLVIATVLANTMFITPLSYEAFPSQMPRIRKKTKSEVFWFQGQLKAALCVVRSNRKYDKLLENLMFMEAL